MTHVYVVYRDSYEGSGVLSLCTTHELAERALMVWVDAENRMYQRAFAEEIDAADWLLVRVADIEELLCYEQKRGGDGAHIRRMELDVMPAPTVQEASTP